MRRKLIFNVGVGALSILMAATQVTPAFAGSWKSSRSGWNYINDDKSKASGWTQTPSGWYYFDANTGIMQTGWQKDVNGNWYFLSTDKGSSEGKALTGWNWIDGYCYYFNSQNGPEFGKMLTNTKTPDGYQVNADGRWEKDGKVVFVQGKGLSSVSGASENKAEEGQSAAKKRAGGGSSGRGSGSKSSRGGSSGGGRHSGSENASDTADISGDKTVDDNRSDTNSNRESSSAGKVEPEKATDNKDAGKAEPEKATDNKDAGKAEPDKATDNKDAGKAEPEKATDNKDAGKAEPEKATDNKDAGKAEPDKVTDNKENNGTSDKGEEADNDKFAYANYTKNVNTDFGEYVVVSFKYGTIDNYKVLVDGVDVTSNMTKVDDEGHVVKWLSSVSNPSALQIVRKDDNATQDITLAGGDRKTITDVSVKAPKYVLSNGAITKFDYFLETYDNNGRIRKDASKTTFTLQTKKVDSAAAAVPSKYYIPVTEIDSEGNGSIKIKLQLENEEQEKWFNGLNNIKLLSEEHNIVNSNLVYTTDVETQYGKVGVINIPLPQDNARSRGDYYVSVGSSNSNDRISLPISLVINTDFKVIRDSATPNPKVGEDVRFKIVDRKGNTTFGNDIGVVMYKVTLTKPDGTVIDLPKYSCWYNITDIVHISGTDSTSGKVYTDVAGVYTATIYTKGYKTLIKKFEVLKSDGSSAGVTVTNDDSKTVDAVSTPTVKKTHSGSRETATTTSVLVGGYSPVSSLGSGKKTDAVSGATGKAGESGSDATSGASGSIMINSYLMYDYDLLVNAMVLNEIGLRSKDSDAVMKWWLGQTPEAIVGEDKSKLYKLDDFVDARNDARLEGRNLSFEEYINSSDAPTRNIVGNVKNVLENGKLGTIYRYGNIVGKVAPVFEGLTQTKADSYTLTTDGTDFIEKLKSIVVDGLSTPLRNDSYLKQYEISADKKSIIIYKNAFNEYIKPIVGTHTLSLDAEGYEKITLELTITDTLEDVVLSDVSEKLEAGSPVVIKAVKEGDFKQGDFLSKLANVKVQGSDGILKNIMSASAGGDTSDSVYTIADGKITLRGGVFKEAGEYTIYLQSSDGNYPVKFIKVKLEPKNEVVPPVVPDVTEDADAPKAKSGSKTNAIFNERLTVKFEGMDDTELDKYLNAVTEVSVNGEKYTKTSSFDFGDSLEFKVHSNDVYGGRNVSELSVKGKNGKFNASKYDFVIKAGGYKNLSFTMNADGSIASTVPPVTPPVVEKAVEIEKVEQTKINSAKVYAITLKGEPAKIDEFIDKLNTVVVNGTVVTEGIISVLGDDAFAVDENKVIYVKSSKFKGREDTIVLKGEGIEDLSYTTESHIATPAVLETKVIKGFFDRYARITFDNSDAFVLENFMKELKEGDVTVTVNGVTYNKGFDLSNAATYKISSNSVYGYDQHLDLSLDGLVQGNNEVVISSDSFDTISVNMEIESDSLNSTNRRTRRDLSAVEPATSSNTRR